MYDLRKKIEFSFILLIKNSYSISANFILLVIDKLIIFSFKIFETSIPFDKGNFFAPLEMHSIPNEPTQSINLKHYIHQILLIKNLSVLKYKNIFLHYL